MNYYGRAEKKVLHSPQLLIIEILKQYLRCDKCEFKCSKQKCITTKNASKRIC